jgi:uncharacterized integral membrane protein
MLLTIRGAVILSKLKAIVSSAQLIGFIIVLILFTVFLLQNTSTIQMNFLIFEGQIPTLILILVATLIGFFGGYLFAIRFRRQKKHTFEILTYADEVSRQNNTDKGVNHEKRSRVVD